MAPPKSRSEFPRTSFWGQLDDRDRADLTALAGKDDPAVTDESTEEERKHIVPAGETIIHQRRRGYSVLIILSGHVVVISERKPARDQKPLPDVLLAWRGPGDIVGEIAAIAKTPRSATVKAVEELEFLEIDGQDFVEYLRDHFEAHLALDRVLAQRAVGTAADVRSERLKVSARLARLLAEAAEQIPRKSRDGLWVPYPRTQLEMAALIGASRESVSAALGQFSEAKIVTVEKTRTFIHDLDALRKASEETDT